MSHIYFNEEAFELPLSDKDAAHIRKHQDSGLCTYPVFVGEHEDEIKTGLTVFVDSADQ